VDTQFSTQRWYKEGSKRIITQKHESSSLTVSLEGTLPSCAIDA